MMQQGGLSLRYCRGISLERTEEHHEKIHDNLGVRHLNPGLGETAIVQGPAFNVTHSDSMITHLLYTARNTTEHG
jgi:hypothetical protein